MVFERTNSKHGSENTALLNLDASFQLTFEFIIDRIIKIDHENNIR